MGSPDRVQLQVRLAYKFQPTEDRRVRDHLALGYRIEDLQRITDQEAIVTLVRDAVPVAGG